MKKNKNIKKLKINAIEIINNRYNKLTDEEKQKHKKNIKTYQKSKNKKEEIIKINIQKI